MLSEQMLSDIPDVEVGVDGEYDHFLHSDDDMDILNPKRFKTNQVKDIVKPQPVVGVKEKHPTLKRDPKPPSLPHKPLWETATDDLVFDQFRKNFHRSRNWKIRLA